MSNKDKKKEQNHQYYIEHRDEIQEQQRQYRIEHHDEILEYNRQYRIKHHDEILEQQHQYRIKHHDEILEQQRQYRIENCDEIQEKNIKNHDKILKRNRQYKIKHSVEIREYNRQYHIKHPEVRINNYAKRCALIGNQQITKLGWLFVMNKWNWSCAYCGDPLNKENRTIDHVVPLVQGGGHSRCNIVPACRSCNSRKKACLPCEWKCIPIKAAFNKELWVITLVNLPLLEIVFKVE